jgi:hypothetical protein
LSEFKNNPEMDVKYAKYSRFHTQRLAKRARRARSMNSSMLNINYENQEEISEKVNIFKNQGLNHQNGHTDVKGDEDIHSVNSIESI